MINAHSATIVGYLRREGLMAPGPSVPSMGPANPYAPMVETQYPWWTPIVDNSSFGYEEDHNSLTLTINLKVGFFAVMPSGRAGDELFYMIAGSYGLTNKGALTESLLQQWRCHMSMPILSGSNGINLELNRPPNSTFGLNEFAHTGDLSSICNWRIGG